MSLPEKRYKGSHNDDKFITDELAKIPHAWRQGAANKYSKVYQESGRREANTRLRHYVIALNNRN